MLKHITSVLSAALIAGVALSSASAADAKKKSEKKPASKKAATKKKRDTYPFAGVIESIDGNKLVLKQKSGDRAIVVAKDARVMKTGADNKRTKIELSAIKAGAYVSGTLKKVDGVETAVAVYERPKPEPKAKSKGKSKSKKKKASDS